MVNGPVLEHHWKTGQNGFHFVQNHLKTDIFCPAFEWSHQIQNVGYCNVSGIQMLSIQIVTLF